MRSLQFMIRVLGLGSLVSAFFVLYRSELPLVKGEIFHLPSLAFIFLVLLGVALCSLQLHQIRSLFINLFRTSPSGLEAQNQGVGEGFRQTAHAFYSGEGRSFEGIVGPDILQTTVKKLQAKIPPRDIRSTVRFQALEYETSMNQLIETVTNLATLAPSVGVLGTVFGLVRLLANFQDVSSIGPNMSLALVTTLYGILFSVVVFQPVVSRLQNIKQISLGIYNKGLHWLRVMESGKPPSYGDL